MTKINIFHLRASNFYGGPERQLHMHALQAQNSEFNISIGSFTEKGEVPEFLQVIAGDNALTHAFNVSSPYDMNSVSLVKRYLHENNVRILCTHDYRTQVIGFLATLGITTRWVAFSRGWTAENLKIKLYHSVDKLIIRFADRIVAVSNEQRRKLRNLLVSSDKIAVVHNAIDPEKFNGIAKADLRKRFNFPENSIICIAGGRFSAEKGQIFLIKAAQIILEKNDNLRFVLFGDGPDLPMIRATIAKSGLSDRIVCPGFEKNLLGHLADADMLVNPSLSEGLPNIVLEAMALKVPVVATAVGGVPELVSDGENGFLVNAADATLLADKILKLAGDKSLSEKFGVEGLKTLAKDFSFAGQAKKLFNVYRSVL